MTMEEFEKKLTMEEFLKGLTIEVNCNLKDYIEINHCFELTFSENDKDHYYEESNQNPDTQFYSGEHIIKFKKQLEEKGII